MRVTVTGGAGFIGSHLVARLVGDGHDVFVLDDLSTGDEASVHPGAAFVAGDVCEAGAIATQLGLDVALHRSSHVSAHDLSSADLVIGFELHHVAAAVVDGGATASKTFLLKELVRLLRSVAPPRHADPLTRARAAIELADGLRRETGQVLGEEIRDPAGRRIKAFREIVFEVVRACDEMTSLLFGG